MKRVAQLAAVLLGIVLSSSVAASANDLIGRFECERRGVTDDAVFESLFACDVVLQNNLEWDFDRDEETIRLRNERIHRLGMSKAIDLYESKLNEIADWSKGVHRKFDGCPYRTYLAVLYVESGNYSTAEKLFKESLRRCTRFKRDMYFVCVSMADMYRREALYDESLQMLRKGASLRSKTFPVAAAYRAMGRLWVERGNIKQAIASYEKALAETRDDSGTAAEYRKILQELRSTPNLK